MGLQIDYGDISKRVAFLAIAFDRGADARRGQDQIGQLRQIDCLVIHIERLSKQSLKAVEVYLGV